MLTRRGFAGCAICAVTGFIATEAAAQGAPAASGGVTRKLLSKTDGPAAGYETLLMEAEIDADVAVGRHTHPGVESAYVIEGGFELPIEGQPTRMLKAGDAFQIPPAYTPRGRQARDREDADPDHLRGGEGQADRVAGVIAARACMTRMVRGS